MARDAVAQRRASGRLAAPIAPGAGTAPAAAPTGPGAGGAPAAAPIGSGAGSALVRPGGPAEGPRTPPRDAVAALARLGEPEQEVVVLRLLLGHSLSHTAHLSGYGRRAVMELQLAACLAVLELPAPPLGRAPVAEEFERRLGRWEVDLTGADPALADALAVASSLRLGVPGYVVAPEHSFVAWLRAQLVAAAPDPEPAGDGAPPAAGPVPAVTRARASRRPWIATGVATTAIVGILTLQALERPAPPSICGDQPCPTATSVAPTTGAAVGTPLTTFRQTTTTSSLPLLVPQPTAPRVSALAAPTTPPSTRPATTAPPTTRPPAPTTTRAPTTTSPTTTAPTTTTTPTTTT